MNSIFIHPKRSQQMKVENEILYFTKEPGTIQGGGAWQNFFLCGSNVLKPDIRLIYLTWGYLLYQEIKVHITIFKTHNTGVVCFKHLSNKSQCKKVESPHIIAIADSRHG